jgi:hypothetical protein
MDTDLMTPSQSKYIRALLAKHSGPAIEDIRSSLNALREVNGITKAIASEVISTLRSIPASKAAPEAPNNSPKVPDGHYAITGPDGKIRFYTVATAIDGKWKSISFIAVHSSDERFILKGEGRKQILAEIGKDVEHAGKLYATETNHCYRCNRELTDEISRARGLGPVCATK